MHGHFPYAMIIAGNHRARRFAGARRMGDLVSLLQVDEKKCQRDGVCVAVCPARIIELNDSSPVPTPTADAEKMCIKCGHCVAVCRQGALSHRLFGPDTCASVTADLALSVEHVEHLLRSRRSIRAYQEREVERETLAKLVDVAHYAPTGSNSQQVRWIVVDSRDEVQRTAGLVIEMMRQLVLDGHPLAARFPVASLVKSWESGTDRICRGAPALIVAYSPKDSLRSPVDPVIALSFMDVAAPSLGLGTCWAGYLMAAVPQWPPLREALGLPDTETSLAAMMVGYPKYRYYRLPPRDEPHILWRDTPSISCSTRSILTC